MLPRQIEFVLLFASVSTGLSLAPRPAHQECPEISRPHTSRCDQYFRCALLPSKTAVWITTQCENGLVYRHNLNTCVVPDSDWECDLSTESERNHSEENVYGIDNLPHQAFPPSRSPFGTTPNSAKEQTVTKTTQYHLPTIAGDDRRGIFILMSQDLTNPTRVRSTSSLTEDLESSGDGSSERSVAEESDPNSLTDPGPAVKPYALHSFASGLETESSSGEEQPPPMPLSASHLNTFLENYAIHGTVQNHKTRLPLPPNGKIHPEHLTQIINQQKQLNRIATQIKQHGDPTGGAGDFSPFTNKVVISRKPVFLNDYPPSDASYGASPLQQMYEAEVEKVPKIKTPYVSEDIIKSILQISKQMIATHQKPASSEEPMQEPDSTMSPTTSPLADYAAPSGLPDVPAPVKPKITTTFNSRPIGITFTNPYTLGHTALYDNLRNQPLNETTYYNSFRPTLYDVYGNRFVPKDPYGPVVPHGYPPYGTILTSATSLHPLGMQPVPTYPSFVAPYVSPPQGPTASAVSLIYSHDSSPTTMLQLQSAVPSRYGVITNAIDRLQPLDSTESDENANNDSSDESDQALLSNETVEDSSQLEADVSTSESDTTTFKHKLYALGEPSLAYNQYKDSIMPLLDADPNDVRISVASCTLGSREPNKTDCFKYFVCHPHNGAFQSFTCPSFTAFNRDTRLCDTASYQACKVQQGLLTSTPRPVVHYKGPTPTQHAHLTKKNDLLTAQKYVELIRQEANKLLTRNNIPPPAEQTVVVPAMNTVLDAVKPSVKVRRKSPQGKRKQTTTTTSTTTSTTSAPTAKRPKTTRKGPRCRIEGRLPNPVDQTTYYVCHRKSQKKFVKMKMTCPSGLVFCAASQYCTSYC